MPERRRTGKGMSVRNVGPVHTASHAAGSLNRPSASHPEAAEFPDRIMGKSSSLSDLSDNPLIFLKLRILPSGKRSSNINELEFC
jgi:hypothetical protein